MEQNKSRLPGGKAIWVRERRQGELGWLREWGTTVTRMHSICISQKSSVIWSLWKLPKGADGCEMEVVSSKVKPIIITVE